MNQLEKFYNGRRVLVTGCHGFKGGWLALWLSKIGAQVYGYGLDSESSKSFFPEVMSRVIDGDIRDANLLLGTIVDFKPQTVFHLAAQPIVNVSVSEPRTTVTTNVIGTLNVLEACRDMVERVVVITSDKCYQTSTGRVSESHPLGGIDPYSASKACSEILSAAWRETYKLDVRTVRAGNVIGGGDFSPNRIIPDMVRAYQQKGTLEIRNPAHNRPWQHVLDCCAGYLVAGMAKEFPTALNIGPNKIGLTVRELVELVGIYLPVNVRHVPPANHIESASLDLDTTLAASIGITPVLGISDAVWATAVWYRKFIEGAGMMTHGLEEIELFTERAHEKGRGWATDGEWLSNATP